MTKQELMKNYTAEQLADRYLNLQERFDKDTEMLNNVVKSLPEELREKTEFLFEIEKLKSEVEKYRKAFEDEKKEHDCQVAEYQEKIKEMTDRAILEFPTESIDVANFLINGLGASWRYDSFGVSELRQIAEHLLVYCKHNKEEEE